MKVVLFIFLVVALCSACCKPKGDAVPHEVYYWAMVGAVSLNPSDNSCGLILALDTDNNELTSTIRCKAINLPNNVRFRDTIYIQYKLLPDTFKCEKFGPHVGSPFYAFPKIEILKIKS